MTLSTNLSINGISEILILGEMKITHCSFTLLNNLIVFSYNYFILSHYFEEKKRIRRKEKYFSEEKQSLPVA